MTNANVDVIELDSLLSSPGQVIAGRFRLDTPLGRGGYGEVWRARQLSVDRDVALKLLRAELRHRDDAARRFSREARLASRVRHPNAVTVIDFGDDDGTLFLAMDLIAGPTLREHLRNVGRVEWREACRIVDRIASALGEAHSLGLIHRDLKPGNVLLREVDKILEPVVIDFGLAKVFDADDGDEAITRAHAMIGTPTYMSPEAVRTAPLEPRSDLYSLGVILFELLCGRPPFRGGSPMETAALHLHAPVPSLRDIAGVPPRLASLVERLLAKDIDIRPADAGAVRAELRDVLAGAAPAATAVHGAHSANDETIAPVLRPLATRVAVGAPVESGGDTPALAAAGARPPQHALGRAADVADPTPPGDSPAPALTRSSATTAHLPARTEAREVAAPELHGVEPLASAPTHGALASPTSPAARRRSAAAIAAAAVAFAALGAVVAIALRSPGASTTALPGGAAPDSPSATAGASGSPAAAPTGSGATHGTPGVGVAVGVDDVATVHPAVPPDATGTQAAASGSAQPATAVEVDATGAGPEVLAHASRGDRNATGLGNADTGSVIDESSLRAATGRSADAPAPERRVGRPSTLLTAPPGDADADARPESRGADSAPSADQSVAIRVAGGARYLLDGDPADSDAPVRVSAGVHRVACLDGSSARSVDVAPGAQVAQGLDCRGASAPAPVAAPGSGGD